MPMFSERTSFLLANLGISVLNEVIVVTIIGLAAPSMIFYRFCVCKRWELLLESFLEVSNPTPSKLQYLSVLKFLQAVIGCDIYYHVQVDVHYLSSPTTYKGQRRWSSYLHIKAINIYSKLEHARVN